jgi:hypothetical protein
LFLQDLANVESGIYPLPEDHDGSLFTLIARSRLFFEDLPEMKRDILPCQSHGFRQTQSAVRDQYY